MTELVLHLGYVHRTVARIISERITERPEPGDMSWLGLNAQDTARVGELMARRTDERATCDEPSGPLPAAVVDWFGAGAAELETQFRTTPPAEQVWTWSPADQTTGFWQRMQAIEAAIHRWDAQAAIGSPDPIDPDLAVDAIRQTFEVMAPMRRAVARAPSGRDERFRFIRADGPDAWDVRFDGDNVILGQPGDAPHITLTGAASDLALFLWHRVPPSTLDVRGETSLAGRYFDLVPPL